LPRIYAGSNLERESVTALINLFSKDIFERDYGGEDLVGRVYEYFIAEFASSEGKRGESTLRHPVSSFVLWSAMLEPTEGKVFDPCLRIGRNVRAVGHLHDIIRGTWLFTDRRARTSPIVCAA